MWYNSKMAKINGYDIIKSMNESGVDLINRTIWITGDIVSTKSLEYLDSRMDLLEKQPHKPITIKINSGGGCLYESMGMAGRIASSPCHVITDLTGIAMSGALSLLAAGDHRRSSKLASLMHHQVATVIVGRSGKIESELKSLMKEDIRRMEYLAERSNKNLEWWQSVCVKGDFYMSPAEALSYGLLDEVY